MDSKVNWVICPIFNGRHMCEKAIESALRQDIPTKLFCVDNGSTDGAAQMLASLDPKRVQTVHYMPQKGVSYAWNRAIEYVFMQGAEHVLVINSDVVLRADSYRRLIEDGGAFVTLVGSNDPQCIAHMVVPDPNATRPHPDFSAYFMRRSVWDTVGRFDESMFNYCSDGDMHLRMHNAGIHAYCIDLPFYHIASGTTKVADPELREWLAAVAARDRAVFAAKWGCAMGSAEYYALFRSGPPADSQADDMREALDRVKVGEFVRRGIAIKGIIHVGANDGYEIFYYLRMGVKNVLAFEPLPSAQDALRARFGDDGRVRFGMFALGDTDGTATLQPTPGDGKGSSFLREVSGAVYDLASVECVVKRFDELVQTMAVDAELYNCLVLDVQGMELDVLRGWGKYLDQIDCINVECSRVPVYEGEAAADEVVAFLIAHGFTQISPVCDHDDVLFVRATA